MTIKEFKNEAANKGYDFVYGKVTKNGVKMNSIMLNNDDKVNAVLYFEEIDMTEPNVVDKVYNVLTNADSLDLNVEEILEKDFIKKKCKLCVSPAKQGVYKKFLDLYLYVRVFIDEELSFIVKKELIEKAGITKDELFSWAKENSKDDYNINTFMGMMPYITSKNKVYGAVAMANTDALDEACENIGEKVFIIPSSIHEILIQPFNEKLKKNINEMIRDVNETQVSPEDRLSDHYYIYDTKTKEVTYED